MPLEWSDYTLGIIAFLFTWHSYSRKLFLLHVKPAPSLGLSHLSSCLFYLQAPGDGTISC